MTSAYLMHTALDTTASVESHDTRDTESVLVVPATAVTFRDSHKAIDTHTEQIGVLAPVMTCERTSFARVLRVPISLHTNGN